MSAVSYFTFFSGGLFPSRFESRSSTQKAALLGGGLVVLAGSVTLLHSAARAWIRARKVHYFAYGANMHPETFKERIGEVEKVGVGILHGYTLRFSKRGMIGCGFLNPHPDAQESVYGVVYRITNSQLTQLDPYEGGYHREWKKVFLEAPPPDGVSSSCSAVVYFANPDKVQEGLLPTENYVQRVTLGAQAGGVPIHAITKLKELHIGPFFQKNEMA